MTALAQRSAVPRAGMLATVRNRQGVVAGVEAFDGERGRLHLVHLEYNDDQAPLQERLLWELEPHCHLLAPNALPDPARGDAMPPEDFDALLRAARWTALSPYLDPDGEGPLPRQPVASPFHGGFCIENYQLVPLLKALRMPRVSLLIADDVGLGKTVEAGLILAELLLRRRIRRVLVLTPASLRQQWQEELWEKFALRFEVVDRQGAQRLRRKLGMDANPWRSFSHIVASYHYLRQPDVLEQFASACQAPEGSPHLPWDLLIVDECHNLMPSPFGEDSELCRMLRIIAPHFEHRLFLSATPHNGHTRSFTGLLEMLDPVRFTRTSELAPAMRGRIEDVVIRRLKRDINAGAANAAAESPTSMAGGAAAPRLEAAAAPRFCTRLAPQALPLDPDPLEAALSAAFDAFRKRIRGIVLQGAKSRRRAGTFAVEILGKRLLSCPAAFAESWRRAKQGFADQAPAAERELAAAERALRQELGDDREAQQRQATAAAVVGAWLKNFADEVAAEIHAIDQALANLGFALDGPPITEQTAFGGCAPQSPHRPGRTPAAQRRRLPRRRAPDRLHRIQDHLGLPGPSPARALPRRAHPHPVRHRRPAGDGRDRPGERQGGVQRPGRRGAHPHRHRRRLRGPEPAPHRPLPAALRLPLEPLPSGAAQRPPGPLRAGPGRRRASLRQQRRPGPALPGPCDPQGGRDPRGLGRRQRTVSTAPPTAA